MKAFISLAISMLLVGLLYVYVRQQFALLENHISELKNVIKLLAQPAEAPETAPVEKRVELVAVSDDESDSESDKSEGESDDEVEEAEPAMQEQVAHVMMHGTDILQMMQQMSFPQFEEHEPAIEIEEVAEEPKVVVLDSSYESMSVKELREKVQLLGGPSLKTKKQLVEYLEKNVS